VPKATKETGIQYTSIEHVSIESELIYEEDRVQACSVKLLDERLETGHVASNFGQRRDQNTTGLPSGVVNVF
jgi:hypothetical protein